jgi:DNA-directed RNA polymerase subunit L
MLLARFSQYPANTLANTLVYPLDTHYQQNVLAYWLKHDLFQKKNLFIRYRTLVPIAFTQPAI